MIFRTTRQRTLVFATGFANRIFCGRTALARSRTDFAAAFAIIISHAGIVFALIFGRVAAYAETIGHIPRCRRLGISIIIAFARIAFAFFIR